MVSKTQSRPFKQSKKNQIDEDFLFVTVSHPDDVRKPATQRSIRSRAMRDAARSRWNRKRQPYGITFTLEKISGFENYGGNGMYCGRPKLGEVISVPKSLSSWPFPGNCHPRTRELLYFMTSESDYVFRPFRTVWFSMALTDASAFRLSMANAAMFMAQRRQPETFQYEKCSEALEYYGQCLHHVTKRLENRGDRTSDGVIVTILGFICHDLYVGTLDRWTAHIQGLRRVIELRGGFENLDANLAVWTSWYDILGSATRDTCPQFSEYMYNDQDSPFLMPSENQLVQQITHDLSQKGFSNMQHVIGAMGKIQTIANTVNTHHQDPDFWRREDDLSPLYMIGPVTHVLLSIPRLNLEGGSHHVDTSEILREILRLSMLVLLAALKRTYFFTSDDFELRFLSTKFSRILLSDEVNILIYQEETFCRLLLWATVTVAALRPFSEARALCVTEIRRCMGFLGMESATHAFESVRDIAWIDIVGGTSSENGSLFNAIDDVTPYPKEACF